MPRRWLSSFVRPGFSERGAGTVAFGGRRFEAAPRKLMRLLARSRSRQGIPLLTFRSLANHTQSQTSPLFPATSGRVALATHTVAARSVEADYHEIVWL